MVKFQEVKTSRIKDYLNDYFRKGISDLIPKGATDIRVNKISKLHGGINYSYIISAAYRYKGKIFTLKLFLKLCKDEGNPQKKCLEEYQIIKALESVKFPVPHIYLIETDERILGAPFIIMEKVEGKTMREYVQHLNKQETFDIIRRFAQVLVFLHELKWGETRLDFLEPLKDEYEYAKKQKDDLPYYVQKQEFKWAINWLESNASKCPCKRYSLLHGDMNPKNFLVDATGKIIVLDWEWTEIGDALKDVGYAYHSIRHMFGVRNIDKKGAKIASYFLKQYTEISSREINLSALRFYLVSAGLREAIYLRYVKEKIKYPSFIRKNFGATYFPLFLFIWWHYRSRYTHLERFLRREVMDYEQAMFETPGGKILSSMEIENVLGCLEAKPSELILDIGTGSGRIAREIISETKSNVIAIDAERLAVQSAKKRDFTGYGMVIADGQYLPFKSSCFDGIICIRALKYFPDYILGISEMGRVLKSGGRLVVDLSSVLGYETIFRYITHALSARRSHVFNFYKMEKLLRNQKLSIVNSVPLQKIPHKMWNLSANPKILQLLMVSERILRKIPPSVLSRSILLKCVKD